MVVLRFTREWYDKLLSGEKKQTTIPNNFMIKRGTILDLWVTKRVQELRFSVLDKKVKRVRCSEVQEKTWGELKNDEEWAKKDGFQSLEEARKWFLRHYGELADSTKFVVIKWD